MTPFYHNNYDIVIINKGVQVKKFTLILSLIFATTLANASCKVVGVASNDSLNVRVAPYPGAKKVGELYPYTSGINIIRCERKPYSSPWCKIKFYSDGVSISGWVNSKYLYCPTINYYCVDGVSRYDTLSVRSNPSVYSKKVGELAPYAEGVKKIRCIKKGHSRWCKVRYSSSGVTITGWVNSRFLVPCGEY
jgi:hypothetical protein